MLKIVRTTALALALLGSQGLADPAQAARHLGPTDGARTGLTHASRWRLARHRFARQGHAARHARQAPRVRPQAAGLAFTPGAPLELHPLLAVAQRYVGSGRVTRQGGPWCRDFLNRVAAQAGYRLANRSRRAIDALALGHRVSAPRPGDLVVMRHHVTIFAGYGGRGLIGLGGNQSHGRVAYSSFNRGRVLAYVRM